MSRMPLRAASCLVAAAFALTGSGCSWAFVQKAPDPVMAPNYPVSCTDSKAAPVLDTICAGYFVANGLVWAGSDDETNKGTGIAVSAALLALCGLSAINGYGATSRCEQVKSLNAMWTSQVGDREFRAALVESLRLAGLLAEGPAPYTLKAMLVSLQQPMFGLDMTVTATVQYAVTDAKTGAVVWQEAVATPHTATVGDAFAGTTRLRLANEGAMRKNIAVVVEKLGAKALPGPMGVN